MRCLCGSRCCDTGGTASYVVRELPPSGAHINTFWQRVEISQLPSDYFLAFPLLQPSLFALKFLTGLRTRPPQRNGSGHTFATVPPPQGAAELANDSNVHSLRAFLTLPSLELNFRALRERLEAISRDAAEMHKQILTAVRRSNKPEPLCIVEPHHSSSCHISSPPSCHL